jgi:hypothetical protein
MMLLCEQLVEHPDISGCMIISGNAQPERVARTNAFFYGVLLTRYSIKCICQNNDFCTKALLGRFFMANCFRENLPFTPEK